LFYIFALSHQQPDETWETAITAKSGWILSNIGLARQL
jgi:hypothetical protein